MGHSADELEVNIGGNNYTLQEAIDNDLLIRQIEAGWYASCPSGWINTGLEDMDANDGPRVNEDSTTAGGGTVWLCLNIK